MAFAFGATADADRLVKPIPADSAKSQKRMTLSGDKIFWDASDIDCKALSTDDCRTKALRTLIISNDATKLGISILQTAKQPEKIFQHGRYFGIPGQTKLEKDCIERVLAS